MSDSQVKPEGILSLQTIAMPADTNWSGDVFGGWIVSQMDLAGAIHAERFWHGKTSIQMEIEVWDSHDDSRAPIRVTEGVFTFVAVDVKGNKRLIPEEAKQKFLESQAAQ